MADVFERAFGHIHGGSVLDVATGEGGFIGILRGSLQDYRQIVGIDVSAPVLQTARGALAREGVHFVQMDATRLGFGEGSFDTVNISASLHHLEDAPRALAEMERVLRPGGHFLITEMLRDGQTEAQRTIIRMHHWAAEVDAARGVVHNPTLSRQEVVDLVAGLELTALAFHDVVDVDTDPFDEEVLARAESTIDRRLERAVGTPNYESLRRRGEELRRRLHEVGGQREPVLIVVGKKRP